ncbi:TPA: DUF3300 domain-containing protein [Pseudomonas aeruginosa]|nr:DUF3300 domain-containing protein [Pseudomonas aeruginosa]EKU4832189.1 DUF3300 domain-containing protein [Pseudomonas aeruginosa]EKW2948377.1 DUF3300 domain-containing protein [Pseudomonas aeruginosa]HCF2613278.1 DUF3300 domain-containing protein [Pseudomonas aeruginosa]HEJ1871017.1 DUF3300 domain-containing protein [Pseudomonas aeruginosa]
MPARHRYSLILLAILAMPVHAEAPAAENPIAYARLPAKATEQPFKEAELDQMLAPLALYPDALLAQVLMASTYPGNVADAVTWSTEHPDASGEEAVRQVAAQPWDPSVQSLVAFPSLLVILGQDPAWVQRVGDAFLAQPEAVMDSVQRLRRQAQAAGNLQSNEQQQVSSSTAESSSEATQTIIIEPADPQVVYVPSYDSNVVYGSWPNPSYPPVSYPPPPGYYLGAGLAFGVGVAIIGSLWGDCDWDNGDVDIDVNRYNTLNSNRPINANQNTWRHNAANRNGVPYRDRASREQYGRRLEGSAQREALRGRDPARDAERERALQSLTQRGIATPAVNNQQARERVQAANRDLSREASLRPRASDRPVTRNNAFVGADNPSRARQYSTRGQASRLESSRPQLNNSARTVQRAASAPARSGARRR